MEESKLLGKKFKKTRSQIVLKTKILDEEFSFLDVVLTFLDEVLTFFDEESTKETVVRPFRK